MRRSCIKVNDYVATMFAHLVSCCFLQFAYICGIPSHKCLSLCCSGLLHCCYVLIALLLQQIMLLLHSDKLTVGSRQLLLKLLTLLLQ